MHINNYCVNVLVGQFGQDVAGGVQVGVGDGVEATDAHLGQSLGELKYSNNFDYKSNFQKSGKLEKPVTAPPLWTHLEFFDPALTCFR